MRTLQYFIEDWTNGNGEIVRAWEKLWIAFDITIKK